MGNRPRTETLALLAVVALLAGCATGIRNNRQVAIEDRPSPDEARGFLFAYMCQDCAGFRTRPAMVSRTFRDAFFSSDDEVRFPAIRRILTDYDMFGSADNEAFESVPWDVMHALGDEDYARAIGPLKHGKGDPRPLAAHEYQRVLDRYLRRHFPKTYALTLPGRWAP